MRCGDDGNYEDNTSHLGGCLSKKASAAGLAARGLARGNSWAPRLTTASVSKVRGILDFHARVEAPRVTRDLAVAIEQSHRGLRGQVRVTNPCH